MKAVRVHEYGRPPIVEEVPEPRLQGPSDVIVEVGGAGLCRTDLHIIEGQWADKIAIDLPYTLGHENAGWVREVGAAVTNVVPGDPVICHPLATCGFCRACRAGNDVHCEAPTFPGVDSDGGMAELLRTNARAVLKLDTKLEPADVAALADAGLTAYHAVKKAASLLCPGAHLVTIGAGGLGHIGLQCAAALTAADITVVDRSEAALDLARQLGAAHTVLADGEQVKKVKDITSGGAQVVIDFVGEGGTEVDGMAMLGRAGSYFVVGYGGHVHAATMDLIFSEHNVIGNLVGSYSDLDELMTLVARGSVKLHTRRFSLDDANEAIQELQAGRLVGRGILVPVAHLG